MSITLPLGQGVGKPTAQVGAGKPANLKRTLDRHSEELLRQISREFFQVGGKAGLLAYHIDSGDQMNQAAFDAYCACPEHFGTVLFLDEDGNEVARESSGLVWWARQGVGRRVVRRIVMEPTRVPEADGNPEVFNLWYHRRKSMAVPKEGAKLEDIEIFVRHLLYLADGDQVVVTFFLNWLATLYQRPEIKIPSGILMYSKEGGVGKSMLWTLLAAVFGKSMVGTCAGKALTKSFDDVTEFKRLLFVNEAVKAEKADWYEKFKNMISEEQVSFEGKNRAAKDIVNCCHFLLTTNHLDALPLMQGDRRMAVFMCTAEPKPESYYVELREWMEGPGPALLAGVLATWDLSNFNPFAHVPQTNAAKTLQNAAQGPLFAKIVEMLDGRVAPFDKDAVTAEDVSGHLKVWGEVVGCRTGSSAVGKVLGEMKGVQQRDCRVLRKSKGHTKSASISVYLLTPNTDWWDRKSPEGKGEYLDTGRPMYAVQGQPDDSEVVSHE